MENIKFKYLPEKPCIVISVYRSPSSNYMEFHHIFERVLLKLMEGLKNKKYVFISGDFNVNFLKDEGKNLLDLLKSFDLKAVFREQKNN